MKEKFTTQKNEGDYSFSFNVSNLPKGLYMANLRIDNIDHVSKLVVKN
jgi:hypothetical protein